MIYRTAEIDMFSENWQHGQEIDLINETVFVTPYYNF